MSEVLKASFPLSKKISIFKTLKNKINEKFLLKLQNILLDLRSLFSTDEELAEIDKFGSVLAHSHITLSDLNLITFTDFYSFLYDSIDRIREFIEFNDIAKNKPLGLNLLTNLKNEYKNCKKLTKDFVKFCDINDGDVCDTFETLYMEYYN